MTHSPLGRDSESETMSIIGEAILSASIEMLFKKLASPELLKFASQDQIVHLDLNKWKTILVKIHAVLDDAEEKQMTNQLVKIWLGELKNLAYDLEDLLDELQTEALRRNLTLQAKGRTSKVRKFIPTWFTALNPESDKLHVKMGSKSKIEEINARLEDIGAQKNNLDLKENTGGRSNKLGERLPTTSLVNEAKVCGREKDKEVILELLLKDETADDGFSVIPILGMGGVGKTTLAQFVYNDARVEDHFDLKAWVCVSDDFDVVRVTKTILLSVTPPRTADVDDLNLLQDELKKKLFGQKFLLVLDDIWNENYEKWTVLCRPLEAGSPGSKIIATTRNQGVSQMMGTLPAYSLKALSNDDCLRVFAQHSLGAKDFSAHQHLKDIGEKIVAKCNGLPLAAKTLGGLLRGKYSFNDWEDVFNSQIWDFPEERCDILPALKISYHYLPPHLKRCFAYCSIFPKDYEFEKEKIVLLWMAEGFLQHESSETQMEDLGCKYFRDLHSRSFFQQSSWNASLFVMHDLINDLAQWAAGDIYFRMEIKLDIEKKQKVFKNLRHVSYIGGKYDNAKKFETLFNFKHLRTFLPLMLPFPGYCYLTCNVLHMLPKLKYLRVLSLCGYRIFELSNTIGNLKHLRYLDLSHTAIETLPESISTLCNLQTLIVENCFKLKKLCTDMGKLISLRHLNNSNVCSLEHMPLGMGKLTSLRTLPNFVVGKSIGSGLGELKSLIHLQERLHITGLENVDAGDAREAQLNSKMDLKVVLLEWSRSISNSREIEIQTHVLDMLRPHQKLKEFTIKGFAGARFPTWLGGFSYSNIVFLRLEDCNNCTSLPPVGQLSFLKELVVMRMDGVKSVGLELYGNGRSMAFPSLETLSFEDMKEWKEWAPHELEQGVEVFPCLRKLSIVRCSKLIRRLPECLSLLEKLVIKSCEQLLVAVPSLPTLCTLEIDGCKEMVWRSAIDLSSLSSVVLSNISSHVFLERFMQGLSKVEELKIIGCKELTSLWQSGFGLLRDVSSLCQLLIWNCPQLVSLAVEEDEEQQQQGLTCRLQHLALRDCERFVKLPQALHSLSFLRGISVKDCPELVAFPESSLPSQLRLIDIERCNLLKSLPEAWICSDSPLERLSIRDCDSLTYIARVQLPPNLKQLEIKCCNNLRILIDDEEGPTMEESCGSSSDTSVLEYLDIGFCSSLTLLSSKTELAATLQRLELQNCPNLTCLSSGGILPRALKYLHICECSKLESIAQSSDNTTSLHSILIHDCENLKSLPGDLHKLSHLEEMVISYCPNLVSFPGGGLPSAKLTQLHIYNCEKLEALPNCMHNLTSLQQLIVGRCPGIVCFPENGFPTSLTSLSIDELKISKPLFHWGLHRLTSLKQLFIKGGSRNLVSFPQGEIGMMLPTSLTTLSIENFPNLKCLSSIGENLTSLEYLFLSNCPKLKSFPKKGLPSSLLRLCIIGCPLLQDRCKKDEGKYWPMIAQIPSVEIDFRLAFAPDTEEESQILFNILNRQTLLGRC